MIVKIAVFCVAVSNCLQFVAIERQRRALVHTNKAIENIAERVYSKIFRFEVKS